MQGRCMRFPDQPCSDFTPASHIWGAGLPVIAASRSEAATVDRNISAARDAALLASLVQGRAIVFPTPPFPHRH